MRIKIGHVSYNTRTNRVRFDRRHIKGEPEWKQAVYIAASAVATAVVIGSLAYIADKLD